MLVTIWIDGDGTLSDVHVRYCIDGEGTPWCCVVDVSDVS